MIINQKQSEQVAPIMKLGRMNIVDSPGSSTPSSHRDLDCVLVDESDFHYEYYAFEVANIDDGTDFSSTPTGVVDFSDFPSIKPVAGYQGRARITVDNHKTKRCYPNIIFQTFENAPYLCGPVSAKSGTYAEYSLAATLEIINALPDNRFLTNDSSKTRCNTSIIPHECFTGVSVSGGWASSSGVVGFRPIAITKRHLWTAGHYGESLIGASIAFKDVSNNLIYRTITHELNLLSETGFLDGRLCLISEDLPTSISPVVIAGEWADQLISDGDTILTYCQQNFGIVLWGNDGHIGARCSTRLGDQRVHKFITPASGGSVDTYDFHGVALTRKNSMRLNDEGTSRYSFKDTDMLELGHDYSGGKFFHSRRSGDSGSPLFIPFDGGWALHGMVSSNAMCSATIFNNLIELIDSRSGTNTLEAVTVASNPIQ